PGAENDDFEDEDNELPNLDHQDDPLIPYPPPEPPDVEKCFEPKADLTFIFFLSSFLSFGSEDTVFDPGIVTFHKPVAVSMKVSCSKYCSPYGQLNSEIESSLRLGLTQQFLKTLVSGVVSRFTRASHPLCEISLGRSDILSSYRFTFIFA
ncbi:hypothetical protein Tco_1179194, partial [Tanacetum coccineum]